MERESEKDQVLVPAFRISKTLDSNLRRIGKGLYLPLVDVVRQLLEYSSKLEVVTSKVVHPITGKEIFSKMLVSKETMEQISFFTNLADVRKSPLKIFPDHKPGDPICSQHKSLWIDDLEGS